MPESVEERAHQVGVAELHHVSIIVGLNQVLAAHQFEDSIEHFPSSRGDDQPQDFSMLGLDASAGPDHAEDEG
jgi:hypothetical protein